METFRVPETVASPIAVAARGSFDGPSHWHPSLHAAMASWVCVVNDPNCLLLLARHSRNLKKKIKLVPDSVKAQKLKTYISTDQY